MTRNHKSRNRRRNPQKGVKQNQNSVSQQGVNLVGEGKQEQEHKNDKKMCHFYHKGRCQNGANCPFSHGSKPLSTNPNSRFLGQQQSQKTLSFPSPSPFDLKPNPKNPFGSGRFPQQSARPPNPFSLQPQPSQKPSQPEAPKFNWNLAPSPKQSAFEQSGTSHPKSIFEQSVSSHPKSIFEQSVSSHPKSIFEQSVSSPPKSFFESQPKSVADAPSKSIFQPSSNLSEWKFKSPSTSPNSNVFESPPKFLTAPSKTSPPPSKLAFDQGQGAPSQPKSLFDAWKLPSSTSTPSLVDSSKKPNPFSPQPSQKTSQMEAPKFNWNLESSSTQKQSPFDKTKTSPFETKASPFETKASPFETKTSPFETKTSAFDFKHVGAPTSSSPKSVFETPLSEPKPLSEWKSISPATSQPKSLFTDGSSKSIFQPSQSSSPKPKTIFQSPTSSLNPFFETSSPSEFQRTGSSPSQQIVPDLSSLETSKQEVTPEKSFTLPSTPWNLPARPTLYRQSRRLRNRSFSSDQQQSSCGPAIFRPGGFQTIRKTPPQFNSRGFIHNSYTSFIPPSDSSDDEESEDEMICRTPEARTLSLPEEEQEEEEEFEQSNITFHFENESYRTTPTAEQICAMDPIELKKLPFFRISRFAEGGMVGEIEWKDVDLTDVDLNIVNIEARSVECYPEGTPKPLVGEKLNKEAIVRICGVWPLDRVTKKRSFDQVRLEKYESWLKKKNSEAGCRFISWSPVSGDWFFEVPHFDE